MATQKRSSAGPPPTWPQPGPHQLISRLIDVHTHPTDSPYFREEFEAAGQVAYRAACCMSSNLVNQRWTSELSAAFPDSIIPAYGLHPWFAHPISLRAKLPDKRTHYEEVLGTTEIDGDLIDRLPDPRRLSDISNALDANLREDPRAFVGEVGLDKTARLPDSGGFIAPHSMKPEQRDRVHLTSLKTAMSHQRAVLEAQLDIAIKLHRPASIHCVGAQGVITELFASMRKRHGEAFDAVNFDLHSFGGSLEVIRDLQKRHRNIFFSFSMAINQRSPRLRENIAAVADDRILVESDMNSSIGSSERLWDITGIVAEVKAWSPEEAVDHLESNWRSFAKHLVL